MILVKKSWKMGCDKLDKYIEFNGEFFPLDFFENNLETFVLNWMDASDFSVIYNAIGASVVTYEEAEEVFNRDKADDLYSDGEGRYD